jgi:hypothetical protein
VFWQVVDDAIAAGTMINTAKSPSPVFIQISLDFRIDTKNEPHGVARTASLWDSVFDGVRDFARYPHYQQYVQTLKSPENEETELQKGSKRRIGYHYELWKGDTWF